MEDVLHLNDAERTDLEKLKNDANIIILDLSDPAKLSSSPLSQKLVGQLAKKYLREVGKTKITRTFRRAAPKTPATVLGIPYRLNIDDQAEAVGLSNSIAKIGDQYAIFKSEPEEKSSTFERGGMGSLKEVIAIFKLDAVGNVYDFQANPGLLVKRQLVVKGETAAVHQQEAEITKKFHGFPEENFATREKETYSQEEKRLEERGVKIYYNQNAENKYSVDETYILMDRFGKMDLRKTLDDPTFISAGFLKRIEILRGIVKEFRRLHTLGYTYLDGKPSNLMYDPVTGAIKLIDFGLTEKRGTVLEEARGTLSYFSSEMKDKMKNDNPRQELIANEALDVPPFVGIMAEVLGADALAKKKFYLAKLQKIEKKKIHDVRDGRQIEELYLKLFKATYSLEGLFEGMEVTSKDAKILKKLIVEGEGSKNRPTFQQIDQILDKIHQSNIHALKEKYLNAIESALRTIDKKLEDAEDKGTELSPAQINIKTALTAMRQTLSVSRDTMKGVQLTTDNPNPGHQLARIYTDMFTQMQPQLTELNKYEPSLVSKILNALTLGIFKTKTQRVANKIDMLKAVEDHRPGPSRR